MPMAGSLPLFEVVEAASGALALLGAKSQALDFAGSSMTLVAPTGSPANRDGKTSQ